MVRSDNGVRVRREKQSSEVGRRQGGRRRRVSQAIEDVLERMTRRRWRLEGSRYKKSRGDLDQCSRNAKNRGRDRKTV